MTTKADELQRRLNRELPLRVDWTPESKAFFDIASDAIAELRQYRAERDSARKRVTELEAELRGMAEQLVEAQAPQSGDKDADALLRAGVNLIADHFGRRGQYPNREPYDKWMVRLRDWQERADAFLGQSKTGEGGDIEPIAKCKCGYTLLEDCDPSSCSLNY